MNIDLVLVRWLREDGHCRPLAEYSDATQEGTLIRCRDMFFTRAPDRFGHES